MYKLTRVVIIGIDALDQVLLNIHRSELPNFQRFVSQGVSLPSESVSPPDSNTAWASIYSGLNPAKHGVVHFSDPLDRISETVSGEIKTDTFRGKTFWDHAGSAGKKVCILLPHICYPVWEVNGIMVSRSAYNNDAEVQIYPGDYDLNGFDLNSLNAIPGFAGGVKNFDAYIEKGKQLIKDEFLFGQEMMNKDDWDLFFVYSSVLDTICHNFWNYCDPYDPSHVKDNLYKNTIKEFYCLYDRMIGELESFIDSDTAVIIMSDHGHGMRPVKIVNINEILRKEQLLTEKIGNFGGGMTLFEVAKREIMEFICCHNLGSTAVKFIRYIPSSRKLYTYPTSINLSKSIAYTVDLSGVKAYSYGGININREMIESSEYEDVREELLKILKNTKDPSTAKNIVIWAEKRENLYSGPYIDRYPDIVFQLDEQYGAGNAIKVPIISESKTHNLVPGSHKMYSPVFLMRNIDKDRIISNKISIMDVAPTVLRLLDVNLIGGFDGKSIIR